MPVESFSFLSKVLDYSLALAVMLFVLIAMIWFFIKQMKLKDDVIKSKDEELKQQNVQIQEYQLKYEAHLRESYKTSGSMIDTLKDVIRESNYLPETVSNKIKSDISDLQTRIQGTMSALGTDVKATMEKMPEQIASKIKSDQLFMRLLKGDKNDDNH